MTCWRAGWARLASRPDAHAATNPYRAWIAEYAGAPYQEVAAKARAHLEGLADLYVTPAREAELIVIFKEATPPGKWAGVRASVLNTLTAYRVGRVTASLSTAKAKASKRSTVFFTGTTDTRGRRRSRS
jgi:hypothetical protein